MGDENNGEKPPDSAPPWNFDEARFAGFGAWVTEALRARERFTDQKTFRDFLGSAFGAFEKNVPAASFGKGWKPKDAETRAPKEMVPLTDDDVRDALEKAGYPYELRLYEKFRELSFDPSLSQRFIPGEGEPSVEIDLMARWMGGLRDFAGHVHLTAVIEAKKLGSRKAFVGIRGEQPSEHDYRVTRGRFTGRPHDQGSRAMVQLAFGGREEIGRALDPLNAVPTCRHWAIVRDGTDKSVKPPREVPMAERDDDLRNSLRALLAVSTWLDEQHAIDPTRGSDRMLRITLHIPTLVICGGDPGDRLFVYDAKTREAQPTRWLVLDEAYEIRGRIEHRYVDVIVESEVDAMVDRYRRVGAALVEACNEKLDNLRALAEQQADQGNVTVRVF